MARTELGELDTQSEKLALLLGSLAGNPAPEPTPSVWPGSEVTSSGPPLKACPHGLRYHSPHLSRALSAATITVSLRKAPPTGLPADRALIPPSPRHPAPAWPGWVSLNTR